MFRNSWTSTSARLVAAWALVVALLALAPGLVAADQGGDGASADGEAGLSGRATIGAFGPGIEDVTVIVIDEDGVEVGTTTTDEDGAWTVAPLEPGAYRAGLVDLRLFDDSPWEAFRPVALVGNDALTLGLEAAEVATPFEVDAHSITVTPDAPLVGFDCDPTTHHPGADLRDVYAEPLGRPINLQGCDLVGANLRSTTLFGQLNYADLQLADLRDAIAYAALLEGEDDPVLEELLADLTGARISGANLEGMSASATQLLASDPDWRATDLRAVTPAPVECDICDEDEPRPVFEGGVTGDYSEPLTPILTTPALQLTGATLDGAALDQFAEADLAGLTCTGCEFGVSDSGGPPKGADLVGVQLTGADCPECTFIEGQLFGADLSGADLTGANFTDADLRCADLTDADLTGANLAGADTSCLIPGTGYHPLTPERILDSRDGTGGFSTPWGPGATREVQVTGVGGVPEEAAAVVLNVTVTGGSAASHLTVWPAGEARPVASNLNWPTGDTRPNLVSVMVGEDGEVSMFNNAGTVEVIVDVVGWYG